MALPLINPAQILDSYRKSDAVLIVCQNNVAKAIEIAAINDEAARVLGYSNDALVGKPLETLLPDRISNTIAEFIEFEAHNNDLMAVLGKVRDFSVKSADGSELDFKLRIIRGDAIDHNPWFHLVLVDEEKQRKSNIFRELLRKDFKSNEIPNAFTGLPNRASMIKNLESVVYYVRNKEISGSFAIIDINHYENLLTEYGADTCTMLHRHIGQICKLKLRREDTIGTLSERSLGILLIDAGQEPTRMVLNRLRWVIGVTPLELPKKNVLAHVNVSFAPIDGRINHDEILEKCESFMTTQRNQINNNVQLVVTHERRSSFQGPDRRKVNIPVAIDRRKRDRRKGKS